MTETRHWFVDVSYSWADIAHVDRYLVAADSAKHAEVEVVKIATRRHTEWRLAKQPPRITYRTFQADGAVMIESGQQCQ